MPRFAANLSMLFTELPLLARFEAAARTGFTGVEMMFPYEAPARELAAALTANRLEMVLFNAPPGDFAAGERGIAGLPGWEAEFEKSLLHALAYAAELDCPRIHVMAGLTHQGARRRTFVENLRRAGHLAAAAGVTLLVEPINQRDMPGYLVSRTEEALALIALVDAPNLRLQLDLYHRQIMEGDLIAAIREYAEFIAHVQIAQPPDRGEPDRGEIAFEEVLAALDDTGYQGCVGCEYRPRAGTLEGLGWLKSWWPSSDIRGS
ncbi:MAG: hydroxypyruvate isomerase family protein [Gammaproteobacteria bacterium]|nr:hydroxypyruvate isomerase family protein [Gammaproteobacteria bacterium]